MTIKEIEKESGMTRANIRYYESEGLLAPVRRANRYRDYSEEDLEALKKIKLLRSLQLSLEEIKVLQSGGQELPAVLDRQIVKLEREKSQLERSKEICRAMRDDGVCYLTLDAQHYLSIMERGDWPVVLEQDTITEAYTPWRRYFARNMDLAFYSVLWNIFLALVFGVNITMRSEGGEIWDNIVTFLIMLLAEPVLLALFGTTPGKWILGLKVMNNEGKRLTLSEAMWRTWKVFLYGMGLGIPVWNLFRMWKSYRTCVEEESQEWEYDSAVTLKDEKGWRIAAYLGVCVLFGAAFVLAYQVSALPVHRGDITVAEFSENYNRLSQFYGDDLTYYLDGDGKWVQDENREGGYIITIGGYARPEFRFLETDGTMTGMSFSVEGRGSDDWIPDHQQEMVMSILAFAGAQKDNSIFSGEVDRAVRAVQTASFEDFELSVCGIKVTCETAYSGYTTMPGSEMLLHMEGEEGWYSFNFSMQKDEGQE